MPNMDGGDVAAAIAKAKTNVATLYPFVARGLSVVVPGPTCGYVLKKEYPELLDNDQARAVAAATFDLMEFLNRRMREGKLSKEFSKPLGRIAYHAACHLRAQKIGAPGRQLLSRVPGTEVRLVEECSAVDGTWGMKAQYYELGRKYAQKMVAEIGSDTFDAVASDCPLSGQRIAAELGTGAYHPVELLNAAYGLPAVGPTSVPQDGLPSAQPTGES
jgi:glycerol-3-phosphate dehydrogenase subunit C